jgi:hypothetical protein
MEYGRKKISMIPASPGPRRRTDIRVSVQPQVSRTETTSRTASPAFRIRISRERRSLLAWTPKRTGSPDKSSIFGPANTVPQIEKRTSPENIRHLAYISRFRIEK